MKHVFSILFLCLIFQSVLAKKKSIKMRMAKVAQALKLITDAKEKKLRKLQNTDLVSDTEAGADSTNATVPSLETDTSSTQPSASGTSSTQPSASGTSSTQPSASGTSSPQPLEPHQLNPQPLEPHQLNPQPLKHLQLKPQDLTQIPLKAKQPKHQEPKFLILP